MNERTTSPLTAAPPSRPDATGEPVEAFCAAIRPLLAGTAVIDDARFARLVALAERALPMEGSLEALLSTMRAGGSRAYRHVLAVVDEAGFGPLALDLVRALLGDELDPDEARRIRSWGGDLLLPEVMANLRVGRLRGRALSTLSHAYVRDATPLVALLTEKDAALRTAGAKALAAAGASEVLPAIDDALGRERSKVVRAALEVARLRSQRRSLARDPRRADPAWLRQTVEAYARAMDDEDAPSFAWADGAPLRAETAAWLVAAMGTAEIGRAAAALRSAMDAPRRVAGARALLAEDAERYATAIVGLGDGGVIEALDRRVRAPLERASLPYERRKLFDAYVRRGDPTSVRLLARWARRPVARFDASNALAQLAWRRGQTVDALVETALEDHGLDAHGRIAIDGLTVALQPGGAVVVLDAEGRSAKRPTPEARALAKAIEETVREIAARLEDAMIHRRTWERDAFEANLMNHPVAGAVVSALVFLGYDDVGNRRVAFVVDDAGRWRGPDDAEVDPESVVRVGVAHPACLTAAERAAFAERLTESRAIAPFPQLGRPVYETLPSWWHAPAELGRTAAIAVGGAMRRRSFAAELGDRGRATASFRVVRGPWGAAEIVVEHSPRTVDLRRIPESEDVEVTRCVARLEGREVDPAEWPPEVRAEALAWIEAIFS